jgi:hypothetical protein
MSDAAICQFRKPPARSADNQLIRSPGGTKGIDIRLKARVGAVQQWRGTRRPGAWAGKGPQAAPNIRQAPQNPGRSLGKALSDFLERISRTQHGTILPIPPDQHHADG